MSNTEFPEELPPVRVPIWKQMLLWTIAILLMAGAVVYQRLTGPTHPYRDAYKVDDESYSAKLIRSEETVRHAEPMVPAAENSSVSATLHYKRYRTNEEFTAQVMERKTVDGQEMFVGELPKQPAAGKMEYFVEVSTPAGTKRLPQDGENIVLRYKDPVPMSILLPHIVLMFFSVLIGMRAGLAALFAPSQMRSLAWITVFGITLGGMVLGPIVQKYAFGAYWTGFPFGGDWTDNKVLFMWGGWVFACTFIGFQRKKKELLGRVVVLFATVVMMVCYLIPHSIHGSELDYEQLDKGADPKKAITTGVQE